MSTTKYLQVEIGMLVKLSHMNHGPDFQALWKQLRTEVHALQDKGYYGDGYWSSGIRLGDSAKVSGQGIEPGDLPEYLVRKRLDQLHFWLTIRVWRSAVVRKHAGVLQPRELADHESPATQLSHPQIRQVDKPPNLVKVTSKNVFIGHGMSLTDGAADGKGKGAGFGKRANRFVLMEVLSFQANVLGKNAPWLLSDAYSLRRIRLKVDWLQIFSSNASDRVGESETDSDKEVENVAAETDNDRREALLTSHRKEDLEQLKSGSLWESFEKDFVFDESQKHSTQMASSVCGLPVASSSTSRTLLKAKGKRKAVGSARL
ncbi:hypothetical protein C0995_008991 [Termitomyces sp. Mi166|nr:hypothetical protein C0995_008991 [Termitomyces sp. Mi166\